MLMSRDIGAWLSLVERTVRDREVGGSNPLAPTISFRYLTTCVRRALAWRPKVTGFTQERTVHPCNNHFGFPLQEKPHEGQRNWGFTPSSSPFGCFGGWSIRNFLRVWRVSSHSPVRASAMTCSNLSFGALARR